MSELIGLIPVPADAPPEMILEHYPQNLEEIRRLQRDNAKLRAELETANERLSRRGIIELVALTTALVKAARGVIAEANACYGEGDAVSGAAIGDLEATLEPFEEMP